MRNQSNYINQLQAAGISYDDAVSLRRISMTLHRWHELECGDSNNYAVLWRKRHKPDALPLPSSGSVS